MRAERFTYAGYEVDPERGDLASPYGLLRNGGGQIIGARGLVR